MQGTIERCSGRRVRNHAGRKAMIDFFSDRAEHHTELGHAQATRFCLCRAPKLLKEAFGNWKGRVEICGGSLFCLLRQNQIGGLGRGSIHAPEDNLPASPNGLEKTNTRHRTAFRGNPIIECPAPEASRQMRTDLCLDERIGDSARADTTRFVILGCKLGPIIHRHRSFSLRPIKLIPF